MSRRTIWIVGLLAMVAFTAYFTAARRTAGPPLDPSSTSPDGTKALVELIGRLGGDVDVIDGAPGSSIDVALVLDDRLPRDQATTLERWVDGGGTLVVTDPGSLFTPPASRAAFDDVTGRCAVAGLDDVESLVVGESRTFVVPDGSTGCFTESSGEAFLVIEAVGSGTIVSLGGPALFTNELLDEADNPVLAGALLAGDGRRTAFVRPAIAGSGERTLGDLIDTPVRAALAQLLVAFVVVVLWRGRRLGRPVHEPQLVHIEASELTRAVGRLLESNRHPERAAADLRDRARRDLSGPLGLPLDAAVVAVIDALVRRTSLTEAEVRRAVADPVPDDDTLVAVALLLTRIREEITHDRPAPV